MATHYRCHHKGGCDCPADTAVKEIYYDWTAPQHGLTEPGDVFVVSYYCPEHTDEAINTSIKRRSLNGERPDGKFEIKKTSLTEYLLGIHPHSSHRERL